RRIALVEHEVAALDIGLHCTQPLLGAGCAQFGHRQLAGGSDIDAADERDETGHGAILHGRAVWRQMRGLLSLRKKSEGGEMIDIREGRCACGAVRYRL